LIEQAPKALITQAVQQLTDLLDGVATTPIDDPSKSATDRALANGWKTFWPAKSKVKS
jgi:hypothetical protein